MKRLRIATRPSRLALAQASLVAGLLRKALPGTEISIVEVASAGDRDTRHFIHRAPAVGFFSTEVEKALLDHKADIAVHSLKDLPTAANPGLMVTAIPKREEVCDVVVSSSALMSLADVPKGSKVGTSSVRRMAQLLHARPDLEIVPIRGNVETRIAKLDKGDYDAIVLAAAGLKRLKLESRISLRLRPDEFMVAPGQGALAVQTRADNSEVIAVASRIDDQPTHLAVDAEREVLAALHGGCSIPLGVHSELEGNALNLSAILASPDGKDVVRASAAGASTDGIATARELAAKLLASGGSTILALLRGD